ncbi:MAG: F0F1 ATP synthase subunit B, partial [Fidelibacterota bacterium]
MDFNLLDINFGLVFWTAVTFLLLLVVLRKFLWYPIVNNLERREGKIRKALEEADRARNRAEETLAEYNKMIDKARVESRRIVLEGKKTAEKLKDEILKETKLKADDMIKRSAEEIDKARERAISDIKEMVVDISFYAVSKLINKSLDRD